MVGSKSTKAAMPAASQHVSGRRRLSPSLTGSASSSSKESFRLGRHQLESLFMPAAKAYLLGYLMDILPAILKALIKFVSVELKRIKASEKRWLEERKMAKESHLPRDQKPGVMDSVRLILPSFYKVPILLQAILRALLVALGTGGMATACASAMVGWRVSETFLWWPLLKYYALKLSQSSKLAKDQTYLLYRAKVLATFISASLSSAIAMMVLQHQFQAALQPPSSSSSLASGSKSTMPSIPTIHETLPSEPNKNAPVNLTIDTSSSWIPKSLKSPGGLGFLARKNKTPRIASLAPAGHFLSRLTSLTVPSTPAPGTGTSASANNTSPSLPPRELSPAESFSKLQHLPVPPPPVSPTALKSTGDTHEQDEKQTLPPLTMSEQIAVDTPPPPKRKQEALGRPSPTIDLTLFALVRGLDTLVRFITSSPKTQRAKQRLQHGTASSSSASSSALRSRVSSMLRSALAQAADQAEGLIFVVCCAQIMWSWFYHPERLPPSYVKWITNLATMDERLLLALRSIRSGKPLQWNYQSKNMTPEGVHLLGSLAEELGHPYAWGDPTQLPDTAHQAKQMILKARAEAARLKQEGKEPRDLGQGKEPGFVLNGAAGKRGRGEMGGMPCELVHCGVGGANCYLNALYRWIRGFRMSMAIYFPVHLVPRLLFNPSKFFSSPVANLIKVLLGAARSAAFLATFIVGNWFPICLARTEVLPRLMPRVAFNFWDGGLGPRLGSILCGFSIFIEEKRKRAEMALYVAPRALFAAVESAKPGWLSQGNKTALYTERTVFGLAVGTVVAAGRYNPDLLRGITGAMGWVAKPANTPTRAPGTTRRNYARSQKSR